MVDYHVLEGTARGTAFFYKGKRPITRWLELPFRESGKVVRVPDEYGKPVTVKSSLSVLLTTDKGITYELFVRELSDQVDHCADRLRAHIPIDTWNESERNQYPDFLERIVNGKPVNRVDVRVEVESK